LIDGLKIKHFKLNDFVFHEGEQGEEFYIIEEGACECIKVDAS
jgi:CRP-like cAMP-binding protein